MLTIFIRRIEFEDCLERSLNKDGHALYTIAKGLAARTYVVNGCRTEKQSNNPFESFGCSQTSRGILVSLLSDALNGDDNAYLTIQQMAREGFVTGTPETKEETRAIDEKLFKLMSLASEWGSTDASYECGKYLYRKHDFVSAIHYFEKISENHNDTTTHFNLSTVFYRLGDCYYQLKDLKKALDNYILAKEEGYSDAERIIRELEKKIEQIEQER